METTKKRLRYVVTVIASGVYFVFYVLMTGIAQYPLDAVLVVGKNTHYIKRYSNENYSFETSLVLFGMLSVLFIAGRFWHAIKEGDKTSLELWESYPLSRKKRVKEEIRNVISLPLLVTMISVIGSIIIEIVHNYLSARSFVRQGIEIVLMDPCLIVTILLSALYCIILMMIALFFEIIMTNRFISFLTGGIMFLTTNIWMWKQIEIPVPAAILKKGASYFGRSHLAPFPTTVYVLFCAGIFLLLCVVCVRAYEKRELSADGLFYFSPLKDIFLVLTAILVLAAGGFFGAFGSHLNPSRAYVWLVVEVSALLILANFLSESPGRRRHWKSLAGSTGRIMLLFAVITFGIIPVMANDTIANTLDKFFLSEQSEADTGYEDLSDKAVLSTPLDRTDTFKELAACMPDILYPDNEGIWEEWKLELFYENENGQRVYTGYSLGCENPISERIRCIFERYYDMDEIPVMWSGISKDLVIKQSDSFGTAFCEEYGEWNLVSVYKYNEQLRCFDSYMIWSMDSIDEIIAFIDTHLQPVKSHLS